MSTRRYWFCHARACSSNIHNTMIRLAGLKGFSLAEAADVHAMGNLTADVVVVRNSDRRCLDRLGPDDRAVHVIRDPRDQLVSMYWAMRYSHDTAGWPELPFVRRRLEALSLGDGLWQCIAWNARLVAEVAEWEYGREGVCEMRAEDLMVDGPGFFARCFDHLGIAVSPEQATAITEDFAALSGGRPRGSEDVHHHYRKGVAGDWRGHFEPRHSTEFARRWPGLLARLGYEPDDRWAGR